MSAMSAMRDPLRDLFFSGQNADGPRFTLPPGLPDPEPVNAVERRLFGVNTGLGIIIQAAKIKSYAGAFGLANMTPPVLLAPFNFRGDQGDAYAACYWGSLLGKFLGLQTARAYVLAHEAFQRGQSATEQRQDVFNMLFGIDRVFRLAPPGLNLDLRGGGADLNNSLAGRSVLAAQRRQLRFQGPGVAPSM